MSETDDLKDQLMREIDATIANMLAECPAADQITLSDMERLVSQAGRETQNRVLQRLVETKQAREESERPVCGRCQQPLTYKGQHQRRRQKPTFSNGLLGCDLLLAPGFNLPGVFGVMAVGVGA